MPSHRVTEHHPSMSPERAGSSPAGRGTPAGLPANAAPSTVTVSIGPAQAGFDALLMAAVAAGDQFAFSSIYRQFGSRVHGVVHRVIRDPAQAEEVTQEVFLTVWQRAAQFDPARGSVGGYLAMTAHAKAVERVRSCQAARNRDHCYTIRNADVTEYHDPVSERALLHAEHVQLHAALGHLTRFQREAILLHYVHHHSYLEVGRLLDVSVSAVKSRVRSGVTRLRVLIDLPA